MSKLTAKLTAVACALALALPAVAQDAPTAETVVATVNGTEITLGHMILARNALPDQYKQLPDDVLWDGLLEQLVQQTLLVEGEGLQESLGVRFSVENRRRELMAGEAAEALSAAAITDEAIQAAYEAQYVSGDQGLEYNAAHILVDSEEEALALVTELEGGKDFAELAREKSTGPSGPNGGALGWFAQGMMVQPFQDAVETLDVGGVSGPVKTQFGWHVIKLNETRAIEAPTLDAVRDELAGVLRREALETRLEELEATATVSRTTKDQIDTSALQNFGLLGE